MAVSSSKSPRNFAVILFILIASLIYLSFNLPVVFRGEFLKIEEAIEKNISELSGKDVTIGGIGFLPYGKVTFKDIKIADKEKRLSYIEIEKLDIRFSVLRFLMSKNTTLGRRKKIKEFYLSGEVIFRKPEFIGPVKYTLNIVMAKDVISIGNLRLDSGKLDMDIKGNIKNYGSGPGAELTVTSKEIKVDGKARINNLYGEVMLSKDGLEIKGLNFFLNDFPVGADCRISGFKSPAIEFHVMSYPGQLSSLRHLNPFNFELDYSAGTAGDSLTGELTLRTQKRADKVTIKLEGLSFISSNRVVSASAKNIVCETDTPVKKFNIIVKDFKTLVYSSGHKVYFTGLNAAVYKGAIRGNGSLDIGHWPLKLALDMKLYGLDVAELIKALELDYELNGDLDFRGVFNNSLDPCLSGKLDVTGGYLKNTKILGLVSDFLSVPSLRNIYFERISSPVSFSIENKEVVFNNILVSGKDINLNGNITVKATKKISGAISVRLPTLLLKESFKLRLLFFLVGDRLPYQDFDFEIGGFLGSPQIKWLSTRFRENILRYLGWTDRKILEESLGKAMNELLH
ncbi:MAG: AsmA-like C-terminal region-containing protein [Candidatus Omnitrophota bacterium]|jgi:hypothetical protein